jgi:hypothetical protein
MLTILFQLLCALYGKKKAHENSINIKFMLFKSFNIFLIYLYHIYQFIFLSIIIYKIPRPSFNFLKIYF